MYIYIYIYIYITPCNYAFVKLLAIFLTIVWRVSPAARSWPDQISEIMIRRRMLRELGSETEFPISEDSKSFSMLLDGMYSRRKQSPITMDNVATILELARKFDVASALDSCDDFLSQQSPTWEYGNTKSTLLDIYGWAAHFQLPATLKCCRIFADAQILRTGYGHKHFLYIWHKKCCNYQFVNVPIGERTGAVFLNPHSIFACMLAGVPCNVTCNINRRQLVTRDTLFSTSLHAF
jgi:hypothetical protein